MLFQNKAPCINSFWRISLTEQETMIYKFAQQFLEELLHDCFHNHIRYRRLNLLQVSMATESITTKNSALSNQKEDLSNQNEVMSDQNEALRNQITP